MRGSVCPLGQQTAAPEGADENELDLLEILLTKAN
jgi:hypothetical protein